ncbi:hypothetical protein [Pontibacter chitinilyticus]|uniref:hypothetical protein n=1 Tax=Pontibacter chitinilyticus TaxID=2674989 RepID=UPI00321BFAE1
MHILFALTVVFLLVQAVLYHRFGTKIMYDTRRYIAFAEELRAGVWPTGYVNWYAGYCLVLFLADVLHTGYTSVVLLQMGVALVALGSLFYLVLQVSGSRWKALLIALLFATSFQVQVWNVYLLTESLFSSGILISAHLLHQSRYKASLALLVPCVLLTMLMRPNGFILLASLLLYVIVAGWRRQKVLSRTLLVLCLLAIVPGLLFLNAHMAAFATFFKMSYLNGEVISGYRGVVLHPTAKLVYDSNDLSLALVYDLVRSDVLYFVKLALAKLFFLFADVRPYYTWGHNLYLIAFLGVVYTLVFKNSYAFAKAQPALFVFLVSFIVLNAGLVMITYADWDGRFLAPLLGPMLIIGGGTENRLFNVRN